MSPNNFERRHSLEPFPYNENWERFAIPYTPEAFTEVEQQYLAPFFTNIDQPIFILKNMPEEVAGALSSRYSRTTNGLRRVFLREYVGPILNPEKDKDWKTLSENEKQERLQTKDMFLQYINEFPTAPNMDRIANSKRARAFFKKWLSDYGDDSIQELGGVHLCIEGISSVAIEEMVDQRVGGSPIIKSSRYVFFGQKTPEGEYQYVTPGEIKGTELEGRYRQLINKLFSTYEALNDPYLEYIKNIYPKGDDETDTSFDNTRSAKRFDDIRDLLPFATQNNVAWYGNGRAYEAMLNRLMYHNLGECRWLGQTICKELEKVIPSFVERSQGEKGAEVQIYRRNVEIATQQELESLELSDENETRERWTKLVSFTPDADIEILATQLFTENKKHSFSSIRKVIANMPKTTRAEHLKNILNERFFGKEKGDRFKDRFKKVMRSFENAHYLFEAWARGGDYRDLHRHRQNTADRMKFTTIWGYDLEPEVKASPFIAEIEEVLREAHGLHQELTQVSPDIAQYVVPFSYIQHWYWNLTAREIYWIGELRTGPQARPHYKEVVLDMIDQVIEVDPEIFSGIMVDRNDNRLARREFEKRRELKQNK